MIVNPWLLLIGFAALVAAVTYTGGPKPYGYLGLGEVMVLAFFGFVATVGSAYVQYLQLPADAWWGALAVGLPACGILLANNVRDVETDIVAGKRTLAVRIGAPRARLLYVGCLVGALVAVVGCGDLAPVGADRPRGRAARARSGPARAHAVRSTVARRPRSCGPSASSSCWPCCSRSACGSASAVLRRERGDQAAEHGRLFERQRVPAVELHVTRRRGCMRSSMRRAIAVYFSSRVPVTSITGICETRDLAPHRLHHAGAEAAQARGEERRE